MVGDVLKKLYDICVKIFNLEKEFVLSIIINRIFIVKYEIFFCEEIMN